LLELECTRVCFCWLNSGSEIFVKILGSLKDMKEMRRLLLLD
jgi:hypothetical protein